MSDLTPMFLALIVAWRYFRSHRMNENQRPAQSRGQV
jgi:hypothetical protein